MVPKMENNKRLIDANAYPCQNCEVSYCYKNCKKFTEWLNTTVDAVEVVRCKNCEHWDEDTGFCDVNSHFYEFGMFWDIFEENDYCSYGERKTDE